MDQDLFNLNLIPVFSENLLSCKQNSSESLEIKEKNEIPYYKEEEQKDKFIESYQKVFNPFTADNKKDTIMEVNDINDVDDFIVEFQKGLDYYYYQKDYDYMDLNGISGDLTKENPFKGLDTFKTGFNPLTFEYIGEYDLIINEKKY